MAEGDEEYEELLDACISMLFLMYLQVEKVMLNKYVFYLIREVM